MKKIVNIVIILLIFSSCYKPGENIVNYEDGHSQVIYDLPGDTLASDGWESDYETGDTYLRQTFYNSAWSDSIRIVPWAGEKINGAAGVDDNKESALNWLTAGSTHPTAVKENDAYANTADGKEYVYRSGAWYQISIDAYLPEKDSLTVNWRGAAKLPPANPEVNWTYCDNDNHRVYIFSGKAWALMVNNANYRSNIKFVQVQYSKSGKETGRYNMFLFHFSNRKQLYIRDATDSARYLKTDQWDIAFTGEFNSLIWLNNSGYKQNPGYGSPMVHSSVLLYAYGYEFMNEAPSDSLFDAVPATDMQIGFSSEFGPGINAWYEYSTTTHVAQPYAYRAFYLRLQRFNPNTGESTYRYGKLQLISMYKGAPDVVTDLNWPSPYFTFRYFIQEDGSRNLKTKD